MGRLWPTDIFFNNFSIKYMVGQAIISRRIWKNQYSNVFHFYS